MYRASRIMTNSIDFDRLACYTNAVKIILLCLFFALINRKGYGNEEKEC